MRVISDEELIEESDLIFYLPPSSTDDELFGLAKRCFSWISGCAECKAFEFSPLTMLGSTLMLLSNLKLICDFCMFLCGFVDSP